MRKRTMHFLLAAVILVILAACAPAAVPTPTPTKGPAATPTKVAEPTKPPAPTPTTPPAPTPVRTLSTVKWGSLAALTDAGAWIAQEKGYFKEQGITTEFVTLRAAAELIAPLATGEIHVAALPVNAALLAAADRGIEMKIVASQAQAKPGRDIGYVVLHKDLADSGQIRTIADLKGMKVAWPSPPGAGTTAEIVFDTLFKQAGVKPGDVEVVSLAFPEQMAAFAKKAIAGAYSVEPFLSSGVQQGLTVKWISTASVLGDMAEAAINAFGPSLLKDRDLGQRWMIAYLKGKRDYEKAFTTGEGKEEVINILIKYSPIKDPKMYDLMEMPYVNPDGLPNMESLAAIHKWFVEKGYYKGATTFDILTDVSFVEYALQKLGKYR